MVLAFEAVAGGSAGAGEGAGPRQAGQAGGAGQGSQILGGSRCHGETSGGEPANSLK